MLKSQPKLSLLALAILMASLGNAQNYTPIPDANFEAKLINLGIDKDGANGQVLTSSISSLTSLNLNNSNIESLLGIQAFVSLTNLSLQSNKLTSLDLTNNTALTNLDCYNNKLTALNLSKNTALTDLTCSFNNLGSLDLSKNLALANL